jgi:hypothetical protein
VRPLAALLLVLAPVACDSGSSTTEVRTGTVTASVTVEDEGLSGATLTLTGGDSPRTQQTDAQGQATFTGVEEGPYTVTLQNPDPEIYAFGTSSRAVSVSADAVATADFQGTVIRTSTVAGSVVVEGTGLEGVNIRMEGPEGVATTSTDASGAFSRSNLRAGDYTVTMENPDPSSYDFPELSRSVSVDAGGTATADFEGASIEPVLALDPGSVSFEAVATGANPTDRTVAITNTGGSTLDELSVSVDYAAGQPTGWLTATLSGPVAPATLTAQADIAGLPAGSYEARIQVSEPDAGNSPQEVEVTLEVSPVPTFAYQWVYDASPTAPYVASSGAPRYSYSSSGGDIEVEKKSTGRYTVTFQGLGDGGSRAETILVTPYGADPAQCGVSFWGQDDDDLAVHTYCNVADGSAPKDHRFTVLVVGEGALQGRSAFAWTSSDAASYAPSSSYAWNSADAPMTISLEAGEAFRTVDHGVVHDAAHPFAYFTTPYSDAPGSCSTSIASYPSSIVEVACRTAAANAFEDYRFDILMLQQGRPGQRIAYTLGYLVFQDPVGQQAQTTANSTGGDVVIDKLSPGYYKVTFQGQATPDGGSEVGVVSPFGNQYATCAAEAWVDNDPDLEFFVRCFDAAGAPKDHQFWAMIIE